MQARVFLCLLCGMQADAGRDQTGEHRFIAFHIMPNVIFDRRCFISLAERNLSKSLKPLSTDALLRQMDVPQQL